AALDAQWLAYTVAALSMLGLICTAACVADALHLPQPPQQRSSFLPPQRPQRKPATPPAARRLRSSAHTDGNLVDGSARTLVGSTADIAAAAAVCKSARMDDDKDDLKK
ncbi:hypothetical protein HK405_008945, partial [Cladochytrium tenue]